MYKKRSHNLTTESGDSSSKEPETESKNDSDSQTDCSTDWMGWMDQYIMTFIVYSFLIIFSTLILITVFFHNIMHVYQIAKEKNLNINGVWTIESNGRPKIKMVCQTVLAFNSGYFVLCYCASSSTMW